MIRRIARALLLVVLALAIVVYAAYRSDIRAARDRVLAGSSILQTKCGPIEYATLGEGRPVLVLHGTSGGWDQGITSARGLLGHGFQIIAPSRFGYLRTPFPADPSPQAEADTWACLLDALGIQRLPIITFSAGAAPTIQMALRHPDRVSAIVLIVPGAGGLTAEPAAAPPRFRVRGAVPVRLSDVGRDARGTESHVLSRRGAGISGPVIAPRRTCETG